MKNFIYKISLFGFISISILSLCYWYWFNEPKQTIKISKKNIIVGDSNTRWSINDSIVRSYANYSTGGEVYIFAYRKLKLLNENNKIDTLLLSFGPHNIINNIWWEDSIKTPLNNRMPGFYKDFSGEEHLDFFKMTPKNYISSLLKTGHYKIIHSIKNIKLGGGYSRSPDMQRFGSYLPSTINETQHTPNFFEYKKPHITNIEIKYLNKIIEECKNTNTHLILIQPPKNYLSKDYDNYMHKEFYDYYYKYFSSIDFLDFKELKLPLHAYYDVMHVDIVGAEYFSNFLSKKGIKNLLKSKYNLKTS